MDKAQIIEAIEQMNVLELAELVKEVGADVEVK